MTLVTRLRQSIPVTGSGTTQRENIEAKGDLSYTTCSATNMTC